MVEVLGPVVDGGTDGLTEVVGALDVVGAEELVDVVVDVPSVVGGLSEVEVVCGRGEVVESDGALKATAAVRPIHIDSADTVTTSRRLNIG